MRCFKCAANCITKYHYGPSHGESNPKIKAVSKACPMKDCNWESYPTKLPEKIN